MRLLLFLELLCKFWNANQEWRSSACQKCEYLYQIWGLFEEKTINLGKPSPQVQNAEVASRLSNEVFYLESVFSSPSLFSWLVLIDLHADLFHKYFTSGRFITIIFPHPSTDRWAVCTIMSRQNQIPDSTGSRLITALIPKWDMCNHANGTVRKKYSLSFVISWKFSSLIRPEWLRQIGILFTCGTLEYL